MIEAARTTGHEPTAPSVPRPAAPDGESPAPRRVTADLTGVPETALWTLRHRAAEAARPDTVLSDPRAVRLAAALDFPDQGPVRPWLAQGIALRALAFDEVVRGFLTDHPDGTVVALGEGLETQFWRVDNGRVRWVTVDLPEPLALRGRVLPHGARQRLVACDARERRWTAGIDAARGVLVTAQGLLMYLEPAAATRLIGVCAAAFPGGTMVFDTVSRRFSARTRRGAKGLVGRRMPPMPWGMDTAERPRLREIHPAIGEVAALALPAGRGLLGRLAPRLTAVPVVRNDCPLLTRLRFDPAPAAVPGQSRRSG
ncbi:class I SAM-dependent methyltransferase [Streptomyces kronopolitis]|uniref:class I SAM-dependent methyltransferase n=1 Tax=Streptomyces kronopolitis TaxID=1612435 RepID=UPI00341A5CDB